MVKLSYSPSRDIPDLTGKVFLVTGGTAGLGAGAISALASHDPAHIYFTGRNTRKANDLVARTRRSNPSTPLTFIECDLTSFASVKTAAERFLSLSSQLHVLMCNAGIMAVEAGTSKDGYEIQFQVNHLSHALLIQLLLPTLLSTAASSLSSSSSSDVRIINLSSIAYQQAPKQGIDFPTLKSSQPKLGTMIPGPKWCRYGQSKLANLLYPAQLAIHHPEILSVSVHPGIILTDLFGNVSFGTKLPALIGSIGKRTPVEQGPYNQLWAATAPKTHLTNGEYYEPIGVKGKRTTARANDPELGRKLWEWTQEVIKQYI